MAEYDINAKVTYDTTQATTALQGVSQAAGETAKQTEKVADATQKSQVQIGQFGSALGLAGQAVGKLSPALGGLVSMAGSATGVIQGLTTAGLGPLGIGIAAVSTALSIGASLWSEYKTKQEKAAQSMKDQVIPALDEMISKARQAADALSLESRLSRGEGTTFEQSVYFERLSTYIERKKSELEALRAASAGSITEQLGGADTPINRLRREIERAERDLEYRGRLTERAMSREAQQDRARAAEAQNRRTLQSIALEAEAAGLGEGSGGGGGGGRRAAAAPAASTLEQLMMRAGTPTDRSFGLQGLDVGALGRGEEPWMAEQDAARAKQLEADRQAGIEKNRIAEELGKERLRIEEELNSALLNSVESALASSVDAWLSGTQSIGEAMQSMVKSIAKSLASEAIIQGLKETALGISALAVGSPSAAIHFAAVGKWAAVGAAAGLVGAATGAFGGGGGGGGAPAAATGGPALTAGARDGAGTTVVINWGSSGLVYAADRAQLGRDISGMISEAHGRLGRGM